MNEFSAYPQPVPGGYRVMMRFAKDGKPKPLMAPGDKPEIFQTERDAWQECCRHLLKYMNGPEYRRDGARIDPTRCKAEALFKRGKRIEVERRRTEA